MCLRFGKKGIYSLDISTDEQANPKRKPFSTTSEEETLKVYSSSSSQILYFKPMLTFYSYWLFELASDTPYEAEAFHFE